jgi:HEAT repeat protein
MVVRRPFAGLEDQRLEVLDAVQRQSFDSETYRLELLARLGEIDELLGHFDRVHPYTCALASVLALSKRAEAFTAIERLIFEPLNGYEIRKSLLDALFKTDSRRACESMSELFINQWWPVGTSGNVLEADMTNFFVEILQRLVDRGFGSDHPRVFNIAQCDNRSTVTRLTGALALLGGNVDAEARVYEAVRSPADGRRWFWLAAATERLKHGKDDPTLRAAIRQPILDALSDPDSIAPTLIAAAALAGDLHEHQALPALRRLITSEVSIALPLSIAAATAVIKINGLDDELAECLIPPFVNPKNTLDLRLALGQALSAGAGPNLANHHVNVLAHACQKFDADLFAHRLRILTFEVLGGIGTPRADLALCDVALNHSVNEVRVSAVNALPKCATASRIGCLRLCASEEGPLEVRVAAIAALGDLKGLDTGAISTLLTILPDPTQETVLRVGAARSLGKIGDRSVMPSLAAEARNAENSCALRVDCVYAQDVILDRPLPRTKQVALN